MALNFPNSPGDGELYTDLTSGNIYIWNASFGVWRIYSPVAGNANTGGHYDGNRGPINSNGRDDIFRIHTNTLYGNVTITTANNSLAAGPITLAGNSVLSIETGARLVIV
jgi:hypothetical protein